MRYVKAAIYVLLIAWGAWSVYDVWPYWTGVPRGGWPKLPPGAQWTVSPDERLKDR